MSRAVFDAFLDRFGVPLRQSIAGPNRTPSDSGPETRLTDGYWLDSVDLLEVLVACEHEFGIVFGDVGDLETGSLETPRTLANLVRSKHPILRENP